jgi:RND superfamily putative drug exporter
VAGGGHRRHRPRRRQRRQDERHPHHPGTEAQNATSVLTAKLPVYSGGQTTILFGAADGAKLTSPADEAAINSAMSAVKSIPQVTAVVSPFQSHLVSRGGTIALGQVQ